MDRRRQVLLAARCARTSPLCAPLPPAGAKSRGRCAQMFAELSAGHLGGALRGGALTQRTCAPPQRQRLRNDPDPAVRWAPPASAAAAAMAGDGDAFVREVVAAYSGCPERALRLLASDNDSAVRRAVAANLFCSARLLDKLASDDDDRVRRAVAANASCLSGTLAGLASDNDDRVRRAVAANASCLSGTLAGLASDDDDGVLVCLAGNPSAAPETLREIALSGELAESLSKNPACPLDLLEQMAHSTCMHRDPCVGDTCRWGDNEDRAAVLAGVLSNPGSSEGGGWLRYYIEGTLAADGQDVDAQIASLVAETWPQFLQEWATDDDEYVRREVAANPHTDAATLAGFRDDLGDGVQERLVENTSCPPEVLCAFAENAFYFDRLVGNASCPAEALDAISASNDRDERAAAAAHPNIGPRAVEALADDDDSDVLAALVANQACSWEVALSLCAASPSSKMRRALAHRSLHADTPPPER